MGLRAPVGKRNQLPDHMDLGHKSTDEIGAIYDKLGSVREPLVSLVVVNWNYARFVCDTVNSIAEQSYRRFECLVIDNGSDDDSATTIAAQIEGDPRFRLEH